MARRIFVVLSQSPNSSPPRRHLEEELVTQLLMESGVEVNVVPHLADLAADATGLLCLEGISGDMVLLSWLPPSEVWSYLQHYGIRGRRGVTQVHPEALSGNGESEQGAENNGGTPGRSIYVLSLAHAESADPFLAEIRRIREDRSVQTFQLGGLGSSPLPVVSGPPTAPPATSKPKAVPAPAAPKPAPSSLPTDSSALPTSAERLELELLEEERQEAELDRLIDQLDELDV